MDKKEAKKLSLKVWKELARTGVEFKNKLPKKLYDQIKNIRCECPLCELFFFEDCAGCPLNYSSALLCSEAWNDWCETEHDDKKGRQKAAKEIVWTIKKWNINA